MSSERDDVTEGLDVTTFAPDEVSTAEEEVEVIKVIQLADIHIDPHYVVGSPTDCGLPSCCRAGDEYVGNGSANVIGTHHCNTPQRTLEAFLQQVADMEPDFVIYTGDNPPHAMWDNETLSSQLRCTDLVMASINRTLGHHNVFTVLGNHEPYPTNLYYSGLPDTKTLNEKLARLWMEAAEIDAEQEENILRGAYYTAQTGVPGLRILVVNSNYWYTMNFYNSKNEDSADVIAMQQFIVDTLQNVTDNGEKVIVAIHHPPGQSDFITRYSQWYNDVIVKYSDVIVLHIAGHTHDDHFKIFRDDSGFPTSALFVAPSVTPRSSDGGVNPSVRVYTLHKETHQLINYHQHRLYLSPDLTEMPNITYVYNARELHDLPDMSAQSWDGLVDRISSDDDVFATYHDNFNSGVYRFDCDVTCRRDHVCRLRYASYEKVAQCNDQSESTTETPEVTTETEVTTEDYDATTSACVQEKAALSLLACLIFVTSACLV